MKLMPLGDWNIVRRPKVLRPKSDKSKHTEKLARREMKQRAIEYLGGKCQDCGGIFPPPVYDFHHRNPHEKEWQPSRLMACSWAEVKAELDKCDLLCANCHRLRHCKY